MWRWLLSNDNKIAKDHRQSLMELVRRMVYAQTEEALNDTYVLLKNNPISKLYNNFIKHVTVYWERRREWAVCYRNNVTTRGINTNNYAEAGIRILKDIVFKRIKAYNLIQVFEFIANNFEMYYERRLLAVAYNRMARYIALHYKGLGASKVDTEDIMKLDENNLYHARSKKTGNNYTVDTDKWTCTCSVGRTGYPTGEPCKHQHAVALMHPISFLTLIQLVGTYMLS